MERYGMGQNVTPGEELIHFEDNKLVDFIGALLSAILIQALLIIPRYGPSLFDVTARLTMVGSFTLVALLLFLWKSRWRARWGWLLIAIIGAVVPALLIYILHLMFDARLSPEDKNAGSEGIFLVVPILCMVIAMPVMAAVHYLGLALRRANL